MHANLKQLLEIRDGLENAMSEHVENCQHCQAEMAYVCKLSQQIFEAADQQPSDQLWDKIVAESGLQSSGLPTRSSPSPEPTYLAGQSTEQLVSSVTMQNSSLSRPIYALAASVMFVGLVSIFMISQQNSAWQQASQMQASINQLMMNSQGLENVLQQVVVRDEGLSADDQAVAERLYWKLTYVDQELDSADPEVPEEAERIKILWSDRVEVLNELNRLFYQRKEALVDAQH